MYPREICCCFTGHRPGHLPWGDNERDERCLELKFELSRKLEAFYARGYRHFICGMAKGCDTYFAEAVLALRDLHGDVTLEAAIPCPSQADRWAKTHRLRYQQILSQCDEVHMVQQCYTPNCMQLRNQYMVDHSSLLLACFAGVPGGTMNTILYAQRQDIETIIIEA